MGLRSLILENRLGQRVRRLEVEVDELTLIYRHDTKRVEFVADPSVLSNAGVSFDVLKTISLPALEKNQMDLPGLGRLRLADGNEKLNNRTYALGADQDEAVLHSSLKKSSLGHGAAVLLLIALSLLTGYLTPQKEEPALVTIVLPKNEPVERVQVSETKVPRSAPVRRVVSRPVPSRQTVHHQVARRLTAPKKAPVVVRNAPQKNLQRVGALAALGGLKNGARGAEGLDPRSLKNIRSAGTGRFGGGVGTGSGGLPGMPGQGLIAGANGGGARAQSAGGYGTKGAGGGRAGYGKISLVGGTSGISLPLEDEALVQGGLDRDQIAAVINRNKGQIIYCYEQGLQVEPDLRGRVSVQFVIGPAGRITAARVAQSSLGSKTVEGCMVAKMKSWQFPRPVGNVNVDVLYPFELRRVSSR